MSIDITSCLNRIRYFFGKTLEFKVEQNADFVSSRGTLHFDGNYYFLSFPNGGYLRVDNPDLVLGIEPRDTLKEVPVMAYIREVGKIGYDYLPPDYSKKHRLPGMSNPRTILVRVETLHQ
jgi:hypothetical protein